MLGGTFDVLVQQKRFAIAIAQKLSNFKRRKK